MGIAAAVLVFLIAPVETVELVAALARSWRRFDAPIPVRLTAIERARLAWGRRALAARREPPVSRDGTNYGLHLIGGKGPSGEH